MKQMNKDNVTIYKGDKKMKGDKKKGKAKAEIQGISRSLNSQRRHWNGKKENNYGVGYSAGPESSSFLLGQHLLGWLILKYRYATNYPYNNNLQQLKLAKAARPQNL